MIKTFLEAITSNGRVKILPESEDKMCGHTKGKLEIGTICSWEIWVGADIHIADVHGNLPTRHANTKHLIKCWNEYDTLKAKEACRDELLAACEAGLDILDLLPGETQIPAAVALKIGQKRNQIRTAIANAKS